MVNEILTIIRKHREELRGAGLSRIGLFGSFIRNENSADSDVDLIIEFREGEKNFHNYMAAHDVLQRILQKTPDIVTPESLSPYIKPYVDKEVVYERL